MAAPRILIYLPHNGSLSVGRFPGESLPELYELWLRDLNARCTRVDDPKEFAAELHSGRYDLAIARDFPTHGDQAGNTSITDIVEGHAPIPPRTHVIVLNHDTGLRPSSEAPYVFHLPEPPGYDALMAAVAYVLDNPLK
ncbi:hypothetical protein HYY74_01730 [Candidatus Woesearchaeota archaeon]|nr:hypothetical protein [Candidatus Woesearchaeota archaeon]